MERASKAETQRQEFESYAIYGRLDGHECRKVPRKMLGFSRVQCFFVGGSREGETAEDPTQSRKMLQVERTWVLGLRVRLTPNYK